jgi:oligopeptide transport system ATP-binding protein
LNLVEIHGLKKYFPVRTGFLSPALALKAVDGVDFSIVEAETFGLVGESGCGKTTLGRCVLRLIEPTSGSVSFSGKDVLAMDKKELRSMRRRMQIVFQDPYSSLDPRLTVRQTLRIPLRIHGTAEGDEENSILNLARSVGLKDEQIDRYPHEFSGGQRQRIVIARALAVNPEFIILDEPTSALDVSVQATILNLLRKLQAKLSLTYLFISHNLETVRYMSNRIGVMYLGKLVEIASAEELFKKQLHPYTQALFSAVPVANPDVRMKKILLTGDVPTPTNPPRGCRFHPRCPHAMPKCSEVEPKLEEIEKNHFAACHLY